MNTNKVTPINAKKAIAREMRFPSRLFKLSLADSNTFYDKVYDELLSCRNAISYNCHLANHKGGSLWQASVNNKQFAQFYVFSAPNGNICAERVC